MGGQGVQNSRDYRKLRGESGRERSGRVDRGVEEVGA